MNKTNIYITCSELSTITGDNEYTKIHQVFESKLQKLLKQTKRNVLLNDQRFSKYYKRHIEIKYKKTINSVRDYVQKYLLSPQEAEEKGYEEIQHNYKISDDKELQIVKDIIRQTAYITFGRREENTALQKFKDTYKSLHIENDMCFYQSIVHETDYYNVILCGRVCSKYTLSKKSIEGERDEEIKEKGIIEIKNRVKELFNEIPIYEKVQLHAYFIITETDIGYHVECHHDNMNVIKLNADKKEFIRIGNRVKKFCQFVYSFSKASDSCINDYLALDMDDKEEFLKQQL